VVFAINPNFAGPHVILRVQEYVLSYGPDFAPSTDSPRSPPDSVSRDFVYHFFPCPTGGSVSDGARGWIRVGVASLGGGVTVMGGRRLRSSRGPANKFPEVARFAFQLFH